MYILYVSTFGYSTLAVILLFVCMCIATVHTYVSFKICKTTMYVCIHAHVQYTYTYVHI